MPTIRATDEIKFILGPEMLIFDFSHYNRELLSYIIRVDQKTGKYIVNSTRYPGLEASADSFYRAIEEFENCVSSLGSTKVLNKGKAEPTANEILATIV